jgi:uncharacterized protein (DUF1778 family)
MSKDMGRPKKPSAERKVVLITLRLTADEVKSIDAAAKRNGEKRSAWIRKALTAATVVIQ